MIVRDLFQRSRKIPAFYPNHVWSIDHTIVFNCHMWPTYILFAIDQYSRKVVAVIPVEGPNDAWTLDALEDTFRKLGPPKHIISYQHSCFSSRAFSKLMKD
ncbi:MAG: transposase family protein [Deltaproteobacteria bacterium]|nr:transposase family protein [Deltaproteobacteria bacterium]